MKAFGQHTIICVCIVLILGVGLMGCDKKSATDPHPPPPPTPQPSPTPQPVIQSVPEPVTLLDTTVALNANATCSTGGNFCADGLTFLPARIGDTITVQVSGPSNLDPDVVILNSAGEWVASGHSYNPGSETVTFTPYQIDVLRVRIHDYRQVGGTVRVNITQ